MYSQIKANKYGAKRKDYGGRSYHSKLEASYAQDFDTLLKAGKLKEVTPQYKIPLSVNGYRICNYYVDFRLIWADDTEELVEIKGFSTPLFQLKWKLLEAIYSEEHPEVKLTMYKS